MFWNGQAHGMQPSRIFQNGNHTGTVRHYAVDPCDKNTFYFGAPVKLTGKAFANGVAGVTLAEPGDCLVGAVIGHRYNADRNGGVICGGCAYVIVHDDPWTAFTMVSNAQIDPCDLNMNFDFTPQVCVEGRLSPVMIDASTVSTDPALPLKVIRAVQAPWQNTDGTYHYEVLINCHAYKTPTMGIDNLPFPEPDACPDCAEQPCACDDRDGDGAPQPTDPDDNDPTVTGVVDVAASTVTWPTDPLTETVVYPIAGIIADAGGDPTLEGSVVTLEADYGLGVLEVGTFTTLADGAYSIGFDPADGQTAVTLTVKADGEVIGTMAFTVQP